MTSDEILRIKVLRMRLKEIEHQRNSIKKNLGNLTGRCDHLRNGESAVLKDLNTGYIECTICERGEMSVKREPK
jgi:hypothetical protein